MEFPGSLWFERSRTASQTGETRDFGRAREQASAHGRVLAGDARTDCFALSKTRDQSTCGHTNPIEPVPPVCGTMMRSAAEASA